MKKKMKTEQVLNAYGLLGQAKIANLSDDDKIKVWKIARAMKPTVSKFEDARQDAVKKFIPEEMEERLQKAQKYEKDKKAGRKTEISEEVYHQTLDDIKKGEELVGKALEDILKKEAELNFELITDDSFALLIAENGWSISKAMTLEFICKN